MKKRSKNEKLTASGKFAKAIEMPAGVLPDVPLIQLNGNSECIIEGCKGILEYTQDKIKINIGKGTMTFLGSNLSLRAMNYDGTVVDGIIASIEFGS